MCSTGRSKRYTPDSVQENMMDYYDHDERERKQMHHSSGVRIYRSGPDEEGNSGGGGLADEEDKGNDHDEGEALDLAI